MAALGTQLQVAPNTLAVQLKRLRLRFQKAVRAALRELSLDAEHAASRSGRAARRPDFERTFLMSSTREPDSKTPDGARDDSASVRKLLEIARVGLSEHAAPEIMLWDDLDLDNPDDRRFGDYELLERIGRGGMGIVFRARQLSLGREVAVKFIVGNLADNAPAVARFFDEARAAARLHHPTIVPVFEVGSVDGMHFFSMPLLRGQTLAQRNATAPMTTTESVTLLLKLGSAVEYAHSLGLLHLDLKPANVLFDEHAQPLIGDFGLARHMDADGGVDSQEVSGTPAYMAPEQIHARPTTIDPTDRRIHAGFDSLRSTDWGSATRPG